LPSTQSILALVFAGRKSLPERRQLEDDCGRDTFGTFWMALVLKWLVALSRHTAGHTKEAIGSEALALAMPLVPATGEPQWFQTKESTSQV
jgi:hypothetical protein